ncbi:MAG: dTDP-4-dehydrorhamnose reductase [Gammaproteobacteria bacterium]|jgi:dTDP-4-dehydrorhamnose reductase
MRVLIAGATGQLGVDLADFLRRQGVEISSPNRQQMDLRRAQSVRDAVRDAAPHWVINCAAYTQVDRAEQEPDMAVAVNSDGARALAEAADSAQAWFIQVSTDFVFSGHGSVPYTEQDDTEPLGVYGRSKREGERAVEQACPRSIIVRTSWLYGVHGNNFVKTMLRLAAERDELRVVADQIGTPTWTQDLAHALWALMQTPQAGVFHFSNEGEASWYDFASAIVDEAHALGFPVRARRVVPITTAEYPTPARRPAYSVLSKAKIQPLLDDPIPRWRDSLRHMLEELKRCPGS